MSALGNIIKKEMRELLTPAIILPIIFLALIFGSIGNSFGGIEEQISEPPSIGLIVQDTDEFGVLAEGIIRNASKVVFNGTSDQDIEEGLQHIKDDKGDALLVIPPDFTMNIYNNSQGAFTIYWVMHGAGVFETISSASLEGVISLVNYEISKQLVTNQTTVNASVVLYPTQRNEITYFKDLEFPGMSPGVITGVLTSQSIFIPVIMMMIIIMAGNLVITSMAFEKENKTLETLLTLPVKRTSIVAGKITAAAVVGLILAVIYMVGFGNYMTNITGLSSGALPSSLLDAFALTTSDVILIGISLFVTLIAALALCMLLGTMAKNYKSVQSLIFPIVMMNLIPMFLTMFMDFDTLPLGLKILVFGIPFSHPMLAPRALIFNDYLLVVGGIIYVGVFAIIMIALAVWVFKTDRLIVGSTTLRKFSEKFKKR